MGLSAGRLGLAHIHTGRDPAVWSEWIGAIRLLKKMKKKKKKRLNISLCRRCLKPRILIFRLENRGGDTPVSVSRWGPCVRVSLQE